MKKKTKKWTVKAWCTADDMRWLLSKERYCAPISNAKILTTDLPYTITITKGHGKRRTRKD